jgi:hypothetical protein
MPEIAVDPTVCADGDVAVSVVFEPSMMHPDEIVVEIEDATGRKETFEVQSPSSAAGVDDLLQRLPAKPPRP